MYQDNLEAAYCRLEALEHENATLREIVARQRATIDSLSRINIDLKDQLAKGTSKVANVAADLAGIINSGMGGQPR